MAGSVGFLSGLVARATGWADDIREMREWVEKAQIEVKWEARDASFLRALQCMLELLHCIVADIRSRLIYEIPIHAPGTRLASVLRNASTSASGETHARWLGAGVKNLFIVSDNKSRFADALYLFRQAGGVLDGIEGDMRASMQDLWEFLVLRKLPRNWPLTVHYELAMIVEALMVALACLHSIRACLWGLVNRPESNPVWKK